MYGPVHPLPATHLVLGQLGMRKLQLPLSHDRLGYIDLKETKQYGSSMKHPNSIRNK